MPSAGRFSVESQPSGKVHVRVSTGVLLDFCQSLLSIYSVQGKPIELPPRLPRGTYTGWPGLETSQEQAEHLRVVLLRFDVVQVGT